jgi:hypothetical protein
MGNQNPLLEEGQTTQWPNKWRRTDNTMAKQMKKDRQHNGQTNEEEQKDK